MKLTNLMTGVSHVSGTKQRADWRRVRLPQLLLTSAEPDLP